MTNSVQSIFGSSDLGFRADSFPPRQISNAIQPAGLARIESLGPWLPPSKQFGAARYGDATLKARCGFYLALYRLQSAQAKTTIRSRFGHRSGSVQAKWETLPALVRLTYKSFGWSAEAESAQARNTR